MEKIPTKEVTPKEKVLKRIGEILKEYNGMESNIPYTHEYWELVNKYRGM